jgi:hypothetical protein
MSRAPRITSVEEDSDPREVPLMAGIAAVDSDVNLMVAALIRLAEGRGALKRMGRTARWLVRRAGAARVAKGRSQRPSK